MWAQYRKTFWPMQALILAAAVIVYFAFDRFFPRALVFWLFLQFSALVGAIWGARMKRVIERSAMELPLKKRRPL